MFLGPLIFLALGISQAVRAADLTASFQAQHKQSESLVVSEQALLKGFDIYLVPGILSETFLADDGRSKLAGVDYVVLEGADHGETVVNIPFGTFDKGRMTEVLFSLLATKLAAGR